MRKIDGILKEFVGKLNTDDLLYLSTRLENRISSDLAEALEYLQKHKEIDKMLLAANNCDEFYDVVDLVQEYVDRELSKRPQDVLNASSY